MPRESFTMWNGFWIEVFLALLFPQPIVLGILFPQPKLLFTSSWYLTTKNIMQNRIYSKDSMLFTLNFRLEMMKHKSQEQCRKLRVIRHRTPKRRNERRKRKPRKKRKDRRKDIEVVIALTLKKTERKRIEDITVTQKVMRKRGENNGKDSIHSQAGMLARKEREEKTKGEDMTVTQKVM